MDKKKCERCGEEFDIGEFEKSPKPSGFYWNNCEKCRDELWKLRLSGNFPERVNTFCYVDMTGERYGKLTVISRVEKLIAGRKSRHTYWLCECDCGNKHIVSRKNLIAGNVKSCGKCGYGRAQPRWNKDELVKRFADANGRVCSLAVELGVTYGTAEYWLRKYGLISVKSVLELKCKNCGKLIKQFRGSGGTKLYCDKKCKGLWEYWNRYLREPIYRICAVCEERYRVRCRSQQICTNCKRTGGKSGIRKTVNAIEQATSTRWKGSKKCSGCGLEKVLSDFPQSKGCYDGYASHCKQCVSKAWAERKAAGKIKRNPESVKRHREHDRIRRRTDEGYKTHRREYDFTRRHTNNSVKIKKD